MNRAPEGLDQPIADVGSKPVSVRLFRCLFQTQPLQMRESLVVLGAGGARDELEARSASVNKRTERTGQRRAYKCVDRNPPSRKYIPDQRWSRADPTSSRTQSTRSTVYGPCSG